MRRLIKCLEQEKKEEAQQLIKKIMEELDN